MITLPELLEDAKYKKYFCTAPKMLVIPGQKPWELKIQLEPGGKWRKKEFETYADAFGLMRKFLRDSRLHDGAIRSRGIAFGPPTRVAKVVQGGKPVYHTRNGKRVLDSEGRPIQKTVAVVWRPRLDPAEPDHIWCTYCRRPTVFTWFSNHHAVRATGLQDMVDPTSRRCTICGVREEFVRRVIKSARPEGFDPLAHYHAPAKRTRR